MAEVVVRTKESRYRGKTLDELKVLSAREVAKYLPARSRRSVLRNFQKLENFIKECEKKVSKNKKIRTHLRDIVILPKLIGMTIGVHNGKHFFDVRVTHDMIGHRLGEFALTRSRVSHGAAGIGATKSSKSVQKK